MFSADQWLSDVTRKAAINKLEKVRKHLGILPYAANSQALNNYYSKVSFAPTDSYRKMGIRMTKHLRFRNQMNLVIAGYDSLTNKELRFVDFSK
jgi:predicted metalloendopeptidase